MPALIEYYFDISTRQSHYLAHRTAYENVVLSLYHDIKKLYEPIKERTPITHVLRTLHHLKNKSSPTTIARLLELIQSLSAIAIPKSNQTWYIKKMRAMGYKVSMQGQCYGMAHMALRAFLAEDFLTFTERLEFIYVLSEQEIRTTTSDKILDIRAFFDNLVIYQAPESYSGLLGAFIEGQNAEKVREVVAPLCEVTQPHKKPILVQINGGIYLASELIVVLDLLKKHLSFNLFSLILTANCHAINLNYHPVRGWKLVDPNRLPGEDYSRTELLVQDIFHAFTFKKNQKNQALSLRSYLYLRAQNQSHVPSLLRCLNATNEWQWIHRPQKADLQNLLAAFIWRDELVGVQQLLDRGIEVTGTTFRNCFIFGGLSSANLLLNRGFILSQAELENAKFNSVKNTPLEWARWIKQLGLMPPSALVEIAFTHYNLNMVDALLNLGILLTKSFYMHILSGAVVVPFAFLARYPGPLYKVTLSMLKSGCKATEQMLYVASLYGEPSTIYRLMNLGVTLPCDPLNSIFAMSQSKITSIFIARDKSLLNWVKQINLKEWDRVPMKTHYNYMINMSGQTFLTLLKHLHGEGLSFTHHTLAFVCLSKKIECVNWLLQQGVRLPAEVFNRLQPNLRQEVLEALRSKTTPYYYGFFSRQPSGHTLSWKWVGRVTPHAISVAQSEAGLRPREGLETCSSHHWAP